MAGFSAVTQSIARDADEIVPHDTTPNVWSYIYVGGTGDVTLVTEAGTTVVYKSLPVGAVIWVRTSLVKSTGTTATYLVGHK